MSELIQLRQAAREIFAQTLRAIDARRAVRHAVSLSGSRLKICDRTFDIAERKVYSVAIGKAAFPMAAALEAVLGDSLSAGFLTGPFPDTAMPEPGPLSAWNLGARWRWREGGHPLPTESSLLAAQDAFALLKQANDERALVIFLISGGGSAMLESPVNDDISLADLRTANKILVNCGASISEINAVRRALSAVKDGKLAAYAPECDQITLIISDVPKGQERNVASGPTVTPPEDAPRASVAISRYAIGPQLPSSVRRAIEHEGDLPPKPKRAGAFFVLLDNSSALEAAAAEARQHGFIAEIAWDISDQPIEEGCRMLLERGQQLRGQHRDEDRTVCVISGGEFSCPVRGDGLGGRNLETALRLAASAQFDIGPTVALCAGTDGIDGNSPVAGAIVDNTTLSRARNIGLGTDEFLRRSDSYSFFVALGDVLSTGATGTNVRDLRIVLFSQ